MTTTRTTFTEHWRVAPTQELIKRLQKKLPVMITATDCIEADVLMAEAADRIVAMEATIKRARNALGEEQP